MGGAGRVVGKRAYLARVYTDEPEVAYVDPIGADGAALEEVGALKPRDPLERANLRSILGHLRRDGWPRMVIHTLGEEGYKPLRLWSSTEQVDGSSGRSREPGQVGPGPDSSGA